MSSYENYSRTSASYDATRPPQGLEIIRESLSMNTVPMKSQVLLDAGCGTGQYAAALIDEVSHITAVDLNEAMLAAASIASFRSTAVMCETSSISAAAY